MKEKASNGKSKALIIGIGCAIAYTQFGLPGAIALCAILMILEAK